MARVYRQGDIVIREVEKLPDGKVVSTSDKLEMSGETGHLHVATGVKVIEIDWDKILETYIETPATGAIMVHESPNPHPALQLPPNFIGKVERVRSVAPLTD